MNWFNREYGLPKVMNFPPMPMVKWPKKEVKMSVDPKSTYYDVGEIETIDIIKAKSHSYQFVGYLICNIIKYACRLNWKGQMLRDTEKIIIYATMLKEELKKDEK